MVISTIVYPLNNFLKCGEFQHVIFHWVIDEEYHQDILNRLQGDYKLYKVTLMCSKETLIARIQKDIKEGKREESCIVNGLEKLDKYKALDSIKIDTDTKSINEIVDSII